MAYFLRQKCLSPSEDDFVTTNVPELKANEGPAQDNMRSEEAEETLFINDECLGSNEELGCFDMS